MNNYDVIIVGAGISGISMAVHLRKNCPGKSFTILDSRDALGGTWDQFRYPGVRADSDMYTLGFAFKPWKKPKALSDGPSILNYLHEAADEFNLGGEIQYGLKVIKADWSTEQAHWILTIENKDGSTTHMSCAFLSMCGGYYDYDAPHDPQLPNVGSFNGQIIHPQFWPEELEYSGRKVVVIGSGATAMSLMPALAEQGAQVTMLQRSPTYVVSIPDPDWMAKLLHKVLPEKWAYAVTRSKNTFWQSYIYRQTRVAPDKMKRKILDAVKDAIGEELTEKHFTPSYNPWDERLCLIPNDDLWNCIKDGSVKVVTEKIDTFVEQGIKLQTGEVLPADIVVTATGLKLAVLCGVDFVVDGVPVHIPDTLTYKGMMYSGIPNMVQTFGYISASWTLGADLTSEYVCRLLNYLDEIGMTQVTPTPSEEDTAMATRPWIDNFQPGYMARSMHLFPKQGEGSWRNTQDFAADKKLIRNAPVADPALQFSNPLSQRNNNSAEEQQEVKTAA